MKSNTQISYDHTESSITNLPTLMFSMAIATISITGFTPLQSMVSMVEHDTYEPATLSGSYDSITNQLNVIQVNEQIKFQEEINLLFIRLSKSQQALGKKFEDVLFNNLWDLYKA